MNNKEVIAKLKEEIEYNNNSETEQIIMSERVINETEDKEPIKLIRIESNKEKGMFFYTDVCEIWAVEVILLFEDTEYMEIHQIGSKKGIRLKTDKLEMISLM